MASTADAPPRAPARPWGQRFVLWAAVAAALFPLLALLNFYGFVLLARLDLGHWPAYNNPDPKLVVAGVLRIGIALSLVWFPAALLAAVMLAMLGRKQRRDFPLWTVIALALAAAGLLLAIAKWDPGEFMNWFWD